jgi:hypothetical protein
MQTELKRFDLGALQRWDALHVEQTGVLTQVRPSRSPRTGAKLACSSAYLPLRRVHGPACRATARELSASLFDSWRPQITADIAPAGCCNSRILQIWSCRYEKGLPK